MVPMNQALEHPDPQTVLVVDDTDAGRYVTCRILRRAGYRVIEAVTGQQALEQAATQPCMIVLDIKLPDFSGFEVCRRLRAEPSTAHIPVLHLSSTFLDDGSLISGLEGGADGYLTQPVEPPVLLAYVRALLRVGRVIRSVQRSEQHFRALFENTADGLLLVDPDARRFLMVNQSLCDMLGYERDELLGMWLSDLAPGWTPEPTRRGGRAVLEQPTSHLPDMAVRRRDGTELCAHVSTTLLEIDERTMVLASFRDVTEQRSLELQLAQADRLASVGLLAAGVAHELNNPMAFVLYNLEAITEELGQASTDGQGLRPEQLGSIVERATAAMEGAQRMRGIVHDLQTFSRDARRDEHPLELAPLIRAVAAMAAHQLRFRARLVLELDPIPRVTGDEGRLSQVFLNLLVNAAQAIDEGDPEHNRVTVRTATQGDLCRVEIEDTGRGIEPQLLPRLFDPFFTTKQPGEGTGLGLAICHRIVQEHGGRIEVESVPGQGSRFVVLLPGAPPPAAAPRAEREPAAEPLPDPERGRAARLLLVDDEPHLLKAMTRLLLRGGYEVEAAPSGTRAQELLTAGAGYDVILCDLMMPDILGMDLHAWLAERCPEQAQRLVFLTGGSFTPRAQAYLASTDNPVLSKPLPRDQLIVAIQGVIERYGLVAV